MTNEPAQGIISNPDLLEEEYIPPRIPAREPQIEELKQSLSPAMKRRKPDHIWIFGSPGTGKTTTTRFLLRALNREANVPGVYVNCWENNTFYGVLDKVVRDLRILRAEKLSTAYKIERLKEFIGNKPFIIILDEIDQPSPKERNSILYNLSTLGKVGLICICNSKYIYYGLEERVKSRLNPGQVEFMPYTMNDLTFILRQRAEWALVPRTWNKDSIERIAELSEGDARVAIQTLKNAAKNAEDNGHEFISEKHIKKGWGKAKELKRTYILNKLTEHHRLFYDIIKGKENLLSGQLWELYLKECTKKDWEPIAVRTFSQYVNKLRDLGLISAKRAKIKGKVRVFEVGDRN